MADDSPEDAPPPALRACRTPTRFLFVANAGPALGDSPEAVARAFARFGAVESVLPDARSARCLVTMSTVEAASAAADAAHKRPCDALAGRELWVRHAMDPAAVPPAGSSSARPPSERVEAHLALQERAWCPAVTASSALGVPGATLIHDFVTPEEEREMLEAADAETSLSAEAKRADDAEDEHANENKDEDQKLAGPWTRLAKRRVRHFGFAFDYATRDAKHSAPDPLPPVCAKLLRRVSERFGGDVPGADRAALCDQLTVNEYPAGVGLAPHVDTHSAFGPAILSVSLAGGAAFEFRLLKTTTGAEEDGEAVEEEGEDPSDPSDPSPVFRSAPPAVARRAAIYLPPRSLLVLSGEARYRWQHYVPHRRRDRVAGEAAPRPREPRRVSFTFRERREGRCACAWPDACDSRRGEAQALRRRDRPGLCGEAPRAGAGAEGRGAEGRGA